MTKLQPGIQMRRNSDLIAQNLDDIATGKSRGDYPALDSIFDSPVWRVRKQKDKPMPTQKEKNLIVDVVPHHGERIAVLEHRANEIKEDFDEHRKESIRESTKYATKEQLRNLKEEVRGIKKSNLVKNTVIIVSLVGLLLSMAYNVLNFYKSFHSI